MRCRFLLQADHRLIRIKVLEAMEQKQDYKIFYQKLKRISIISFIIGLIIASLSGILIGGNLVRFPDLGAIILALAFGFLVLSIVMPIGLITAILSCKKIKQIRMKFYISTHDKFYILSKVGIILCLIPLAFVLIDFLIFLFLASIVYFS